MFLLSTNHSTGNTGSSLAPLCGPRPRQPLNTKVRLIERDGVDLGPVVARIFWNGFCDASDVVIEIATRFSALREKVSPFAEKLWLWRNNRKSRRVIRMFFKSCHFVFIWKPGFQTMHFLAGKVIMHDPFAMRPFFGYNFGNYLKHWLSVNKEGRHMPRIYHVNWFRKVRRSVWRLDFTCRAFTVACFGWKRRDWSS